MVWIAPPDVFSPEDGSLLDDNSSTLSIFDEDMKETEQSCRAHQMGMKAVLGPGDLLILPPGWWHAMRSLSKVSVIYLLFSKIILLTLLPPF